MKKKSLKKTPAIRWNDDEIAHRLYEEGIALSTKGMIDRALEAWKTAVIIIPDHTDSLANLGGAMKTLGIIDAAILAYRRAIYLRPDFVEVLVNIAPILGDINQPEEAESFCRQAISLRQDMAVAHSNLGVALRLQELTDKAIIAWRKAVILKPDYANAYGNLGNGLIDVKNQDEAVPVISHFIHLNPYFPDSYVNLANILRKKKKFVDAEELCRKALLLKEDHVPALAALAELARAQRQFDEYGKIYRKIVSLVPDQGTVYNNFGIVSQESGNSQVACTSFRRGAILVPEQASPYDNMGSALHSLGFLEEAWKYYRKAMVVKPSYPAIYSNLCYFLNSYGKQDEAVLMGWRAIRIDYGFVGAHNNISMALLTQGNFYDGWREFEWRWQTPLMNSVHRDFTEPQWQGEDGYGRTILIHAEQGYGDTLQFCRYVPMVAARGWRVVLEVPSGLIRLLSDLPGVAQSLINGEDLPDFDVHCPMLSLPLVFKTSLRNIPASLGYLQADKAACDYWKHRLESAYGSVRRVGLAWAGNPRQHDANLMACDQRRSINPEMLFPLMENNQIRFFSVQKGGPTAPAHFPLIDFMNEMRDFADTAALVANLDLVITVDTAIAHLAAGLGRPVWLLDRFDACWRWLRGREDSPWYPTLRIFRQEKHGDWVPVIDRVKKCLEAEEKSPLPPFFKGGEKESTPFSKGGRKESPPFEKGGRGGFLTPDALTANALAKCNLGTDLFQQNRLDEAMLLWHEAVDIDQFHAGSHYNLGLGWKAQNLIDKSEIAYRKAIIIEPDFAPAYGNLGNILRGFGGIDDAITLLRHSLLLQPHSAIGYYNLGNILAEKGDGNKGLALRSHLSAISLHPGYANAWLNAGNMRRDLGQPDIAMLCWAKTIKIDQLIATAYGNMAARFQADNQFHQAKHFYHMAIIASGEQKAGEDPEYYIFYNNLGIVSYALEHMDQAISIFRRVTKLVPDSGDAHFNLSAALLRHGNFPEGWREFEWRWQTSTLKETIRYFSKPQWNGEEGRGRKLLVYAEMGYGDVLQFCRYLPLAAARGWKIILEVWAPLQRLLGQIDAVDFVAPTGEPLPEFDAHCPIASLPMIFNTNFYNIPGVAGYLHADRGDIKKWKHRLALVCNKNLKVGLVWSGNPRSEIPKLAKVDSRRSMPIKFFEPIFQCHGISFINLQKEGPTAPSHFDLIDFMDEIEDFADSAALITNLDLVISVDTSVVHLAGALGKTVWLLDRFDSCWRWFTGRDDSPWYSSFRIFRQNSPGDWAGVIERVKEALLGWQQNPPYPPFPKGGDLLQLYSPPLEKGGRGDFADTTLSFRKNIADKPGHPAFYSALATMFYEHKQMESAVFAWRRSIIMAPDNADYYSNAGAALKLNDQQEIAITFCHKAIVLQPDHVSAYVNLRMVIDNLSNIIGLLERIVNLVPASSDARFNLGSALFQQRRMDEAIVSYRMSVIMNPDKGIIWHNLSVTTLSLNQYLLQKAIDLSRRAVIADPYFADARYNLGRKLFRIGNIDAAATVFQQAIIIDPYHINAHHNLSVTLLAQGNFHKGWREYEWRWLAPRMAADMRIFPVPQWHGEEGMGRKLLVHGEQGFGDILQFCRYVPLIAAKGWKVIVELRPQLARIMKSLKNVYQFVAYGEKLPVFDAHCPMLSLPLAFDTSINTVPSHSPYLHPEESQVNFWHNYLGDNYGKIPRIGLAWAGSPAHISPCDQRRSIMPELLAPLVKRHDLLFFSLQKGGPKAPDELQLIDFMEDMDDFADTAALIANLDLVISVDTAIVHLAGALGKPVWMLDRYDACWRWLRGRDDSPWYPFLRIFRQKVAGDWGGVIERVGRELDRYLGREYPPYPPLSKGGNKAEANPPPLKKGGRGDFADTPLSLRKDIADKPNNSALYPILATLLYEQKQMENSVFAWCRSTIMDPYNADNYSNMGAILTLTGQSNMAIISCRKSIILQPDNVSAYINIRMAIAQSGNFDEIIGLLNRIVNLSPDSSEAWCNFGSAMFGQERVDEAVVAWERAVECNNFYAEAHYNLGLARKAQGRRVEAMAAYRRAIIIKCNVSSFWNNLGNVLQEHPGMAKEISYSYNRALILSPDSAEVYYNMGNMLDRECNLELAASYYEEAIRKKHDYGDAHFNLAMNFLKRGNFEAGWREYEWRWQSPSMKFSRRSFPTSQWHGEAGDGKTLLVYGEQGFGDILQFCRYIPMIAARGWRVLLETRAELFRLMQGLTGIDQLVTAGETLPDFDVHCPLLSLPGIFGTRVDNIPASSAYLQAIPSDVKMWKKRLDDKYGDAPRIGLSWAGNPRLSMPSISAIDRRRSMSPEKLLPLFRCKGINFFSLQKYGSPVPKDFPLIDFMEEVNDFADTAALIANLDLVISVDSAVLHLAAALGKETWLLDRFDSCWRWLQGRDDSPWYPSLRIFRQSKQGDWDSVIERVKAALLGRENPPYPPFSKGEDNTKANPPPLEKGGRGDFADAPLHLRKDQTIVSSPDDVSGYLNLREALRGRGHPKHVLFVLSRIACLLPASSEARCNWGATLYQHDRLDDAVRVWREATELNPYYSEVYYNIGIAGIRTGKGDEAVVILKKSVITRCDFYMSYVAIGKYLYSKELFLDAKKLFVRAVCINQHVPDIYTNLGKALYKQDFFEDAGFCWRKAIILDPINFDSYMSMEQLLYQEKQMDESFWCGQRTIFIDPRRAVCHKNLGIFYHDREQLDKTEHCYKTALIIEPDNTTYYSNISFLEFSFGYLDRAVVSARRSINIQHDYVLAHFNLCAALMAQGDFGEAGQEFEWRWKHKDMFPLRRHYPKPLWRGEPGNGRTLFIHDEGGYGDHIQRSRFIKEVAARGWRVLLEAKPPLIRLAGSVEGVSEIVPFGTEPPPFDSYCSMGSMVFNVCKRMEDIPNAIYLRPDTVAAKKWGERLLADYGDRPRIALAWSGSVVAGSRTMPTEPLRTLFDSKSSCLFFNIHKDKVEIPDDFPLIDLMDEIEDFKDTTALLENLDLVIAVDTAIIHLAGAMGKPAWLLARFSTDPRWLRERSDSPWYPTVRIFRQTSPGDWDSAVAQVKKELVHWVEKSPLPPFSKGGEFLSCRESPPFGKGGEGGFFAPMRLP